MKDSGNDDITAKGAPVDLAQRVLFKSKAMASRRAWETTRVIEEGLDPPRLFEDHFAEALAGTEFMDDFFKALKANGAQYYRFFSVRTRFIDDAITENMNHIYQVVILGSGMDTRAYRLQGLSLGVKIWEIDSAELHDCKNQILHEQNAPPPRCRRITVAADLQTSEWVDKLLETGFDKSQPTVWILEGVIYYLAPDSAEKLLSQISSLSAVKSVFVGDMMNRADMVNAQPTWQILWKFSCEDPVALLEKHGWKSVQAKVDYEIATPKYPGYDKQGVECSMGVLAKNACGWFTQHDK